MESAAGSCDEVGTEHHDDAEDITGIVTSLFGSERLMVVVPTAREPTASPDDDEGDTVESRVRRILESTLRDTPLRERSHRVGQARFLLEGMDAAGCSPAERRTVLESLALQPEYFRRQVRVLLETKHFVFVDKPFDMQISHGRAQSARFEGEATVEEELLTMHATQNGAGPAASTPTYMRCHNLDFATSGVLMMGKTSADVAAASRAFDPTREGPTSVAKEYVAVVLGWPAWDRTVIDAPIEGDPDSPFKMRVAGQHKHGPVVREDAVVDADVAARWGPSRLPPAPRWDRDMRAGKPREAVSAAVVERRGVLALAGPLCGRKISLVRLHPSTGRRHQLRVHLASRGHPILGDVSYAGDISTHRLCLHAVALTFSHAVADEPGVFPPHGLRVATHEGTTTPFDSFFGNE